MARLSPINLRIQPTCLAAKAIHVDDENVIIRRVWLCPWLEKGHAGLVKLMNNYALETVDNTKWRQATSLAKHSRQFAPSPDDTIPHRDIITDLFPTPIWTYY